MPPSIRSSKFNWATSQHTVKIIVFAAFFLSGLSGLVYETIWMRMLTFVFGSTTLAVSTALAAFMSGLALGSYALGKFADKTKHHLKTYVVLEMLVGLYGLTTLLTLSNLDTLYLPLLPSLHSDYVLLTAVRFVLAFLVIGIGAFLMGGTLPLISRILIKDKGAIGEQFAAIYAANTFGAVLGVLLAGYFLIPMLGLHNGIGVAACINFTIAAACFFLLIKRKNVSAVLPISNQHSKNTKLQSAADQVDAVADEPRHLKMLLLAFALSGFASLACQVLWTKSLALIIGSSVYAFTIMLATFLFGIAAGSMAMGALFNRVKQRPYFWLGLMQLGIAFSILVGEILIGKLPLIFLSLTKWLPHNFFAVQLVEFFVVALTMLPSTLLMGAAFPLVCRIYAGNEIADLGVRLGLSYAINTVGAVVGAITAGFILVPYVGTENSFQILAGINMLIGLVFVVMGCGSRNKFAWMTVGASISAALLIAILSPAWNYILVQGNLPYLIKVLIDRPQVMEQILSGKMLYREEDISGSAMVYQMYDGSINLNLSGHNEGGTYAGDMNVQIEEAVLPVLLHKAPKKVLLVGLGTGIALGALLQSDEVEQIDVLEISSGAVKANHFFAPYNNNALQDKRVNIIIDDGRHFMAYTKKKYDLVMNTPSYSWVSGTANIFTQDFFMLARKRLETGGIFVSWFHLYGITPPDIKRFAGTVHSVFPHTSLWLSSSSAEFIALGSEQTLAVDYAAIQHKLKSKKLANELARVSSPTPEAVLGLYLMSDDKIADYVAEAEINTDDRPLMEFSIPRSLFSWQGSENIQSLVGSRYAAFLPMTGMAYQDGQNMVIPIAGLKSHLPDWTLSASFANLFEYHTGRLNRSKEIKLTYDKNPYQFDFYASPVDSTPDQLRAALHPFAQGGVITPTQFAGHLAYMTQRKTATHEEIFVSWACQGGAVSLMGRFSAPLSQQGNSTAWASLAQGLQCYKPMPER